MNLQQKALQNLENILEKNYLINSTERLKDNFAIIYDLQSPLAKLLSETYFQLLPKAKKLAFYEYSAEEVKDFVNSLVKGSLVVLVESSSFRMSSFRWRLELFNRSLKVIEHAHLGTNLPEESENYVDSLEDQNARFQSVGNFLKGKLEKCSEVKICSDSENILTYSSEMEPVKKNIADFSGMHNIGCAFPIGEVFTEPKNLGAINGSILVYALANEQFRVVIYDNPFKVTVKNGVIEWDENFPEEFKQIYGVVSKENNNGAVPIRELGLGMNKGISKEKKLTDISAFERVCGPHISVGLKHDIYRDKFDKNTVQHFHIDIFPVCERIEIDGLTVFENGDYQLS